MPDYLLTYDLDTHADSELNKKFRRAAMDQDLSCLWESTMGVLYQLPETTLWGAFTNSEAVKSAMIEALITTGLFETGSAGATRAFITRISEPLLEPHGPSMALETDLVGPTSVRTCINHQRKLIE